MGFFSKPTWGLPIDWANAATYPGGTGLPWAGQPTVSGHALAGGVAPRMLLVGGGEWAESQPVIGNTSAVTYP
jgi:hypothetical protein